MAKKKNNKSKIEEIKEEIVETGAVVNEEEVEETSEMVFEEETEEQKEVTIMDMLNRIVVCLIIIAIILAINTVVLICNGGTSKSEAKPETNNSETTNESTDSGYDVSMMDSISLSDALGLFSDKGSYVIYIGRSDCGACVSYLPALQKAQSDLGYTTKYLNLYDMDESDANYSKFIDKLTVKYPMQVNGEEVTKEFGEWVGYTPMTVVIKNGKMVDGEIGAISYDSLVSMLKEHGFGK